MSKAAELAALIGSQTALSNRNFVINGGMNVAQRATSAAVTTSSGYFTVDRFRTTATSDTAGRLTQSQATITDLPGFANAIKLDCTTADTSIAAGEILVLATRFEGQNLQSLAKGTSSAKAVTVSFYAKGTAKKYMCELTDQDNTRSIRQQFTVSSSWQRFSIVFPGDTTGAFDDDNALSSILGFWLHAGSTYSGGSYTANTWASTVTNTRASGIDSFFSSTDNELFITGLQMEIGEQATPFEHRSYGEELAACQRYYETLIIGAGNFDIASTERTADDDRAKWDFKVRKRANCTAALGAGGSWGTGTPTFYNGTENVNFNRAGIFNLNGTGGTIGLVADSEL